MRERTIIDPSDIDQSRQQPVINAFVEANYPTGGPRAKKTFDMPSREQTTEIDTSRTDVIDWQIEAR